MERGDARQTRRSVRRGGRRHPAHDDRRRRPRPGRCPLERGGAGQARPPYVAEAAEALRKLIVDRQLGPQELWPAAKALGNLGDSYRPETAQTLHAVALDVTATAADRGLACKALGELGCHHLTEASDILWSMIDDPAIGAQDRCRALKLLVGLRPEAGPEITADLRESITTPLWTPLIDGAGPRCSRK